MTSAPNPGINRRRTLIGAAAVVAGVPVLAACGEDEPASGGSTSGTDTESSSPSPSASESSSAAEGGAAALASTADVPVGGCFVVGAAKVVITQPSEGDFRAFSAVCTHQGCPVSSSSDGVIPCNCHGSTFALEDGAVLDGPATRPLEAVEITVDGDAITMA